VIRFKKENPHWGYTRIRDYIVHLGYKIGETTVKNILVENGYDPEPDLTRKTTWKEFIKSLWEVLAACDFFSVELLIKGKLVRCMVFFAIEQSTRKVGILGLHLQPNGLWMEQIARNISGEGGFLAGKKYLTALFEDNVSAVYARDICQLPIVIGKPISVRAARLRCPWRADRARCCRYRRRIGAAATAGGMPCGRIESRGAVGHRRSSICTYE
jgi:hypothetical protein